MQTELKTDQSTVTWVMTVYLLSASICTPIIGRVGDAIGKRRMLVCALVCLTVGSLVSGVAEQISVMIIGRVIQGAGGGVLPLAFGIIRDELPGRRVPGAIGLLASLGAVGGGIGIVLAGPIVQFMGYHWLFWLPSIVTGLAAAAAHLVIPDSPSSAPGPISVAPVILLSSWLVCLLLAVSRGHSWGWSSPPTLGLLSGAVALFAVWVTIELRSAAPLIDMPMMKLPTVAITNSVSLLVGFGIYAGYAFLPQFTQTPTSTGYGFGASITESGIILLPMACTMFSVGMLSGTLVRMTGPKAVVILGCLVSAASMAMLAVAHSERWMHYVANAAMGVGTGLVLACLSNLIVAAVPPGQTGVATGMNANIRTIGGSIGTAVIAGIVTADHAADGLPRETGYTHGFWAMSTALVLAAAVAMLIPRRTAGGSKLASHLARARCNRTPTCGPSAATIGQCHTTREGGFMTIGQPADAPEPTPAEPISDRIVAALQRRILSGEIPIGAWLRHGALAEEFGVSRTPVREALKILHSQGVVAIDPHRGARVNGHSGKDIREIGAVRAELEGFAAELATERINDAQLKRMREAWEGFGDAIQQLSENEEDQRIQAERWVESNNQFHSVIVEASGNHQLVLSIAELKRRLPQNLSYGAYAGNSRLLLKNLEQHEGIASAIINHDARLARRLMVSHLRSSNEATARWVESNKSHA
ncbi:hypothetical protein GCM10023350_08160 [Nocardioides endophyticus]|uniref:FCD domain-containing protein n=2 Tax=Nocardioides endophyticus TaxID=1353775 RepID=A0ABP8YG12_9ACTN